METSKTNPQTNGITIVPADSADKAMFYAMSQRDALIRSRIGHVRIDFGMSGNEFWHTWHEQAENSALNDARFKSDIQEVMDFLKGFVLKDRRSMRVYCRANGTLLEDGLLPRYGFAVETTGYRYYLRCSPAVGDYNAYLNCFKK